MGKGLAKEHMCIAHGHREQCGDGQREWGGVGSGKKGAKGREMGTSAIASIKE